VSSEFLRIESATRDPCRQLTWLPQVDDDLAKKGTQSLTHEMRPTPLGGTDPTVGPAPEVRILLS